MSVDMGRSHICGTLVVEARSKSALVQRAFTLIEVLVVVAIIGLLVAILVPSLSLAKEQAKRVLCMSQLKQQALAFVAYASESKGNMPWAGGGSGGGFRYPLMAGLAQVLPDDQIPAGQANCWVPVNIGGLYPKYISKQAAIFYCPSCKFRPEDPDRGIHQLQYLTNHPMDSGLSWHDQYNAPIGTYTYARPAAVGRYPRDEGAKMYPLGAIQSDAGTVFNPADDDTWADAWSYINCSAASDWLIPISKESRLKSSLPAFISDAFYGGFLGYHIDGYNVLYADMHARRVRDPNRKIAIAGLGSGSGDPSVFKGTSAFKVFQVWDYFGRFQ